MSSRQRLLQIKNPQQVSQAIIGSMRGLSVESSITLTWILGQRSRPLDIKTIGKRLQFHNLVRFNPRSGFWFSPANRQSQPTINAA